jgi:DNA-directed RNA polymerase III subunit RPC4
LELVPSNTIKSGDNGTVKTEGGSGNSVREILTQARRKEMEAQSKRELASGIAAAAGRGPRKQVIRTDVEDGSRKMIIDSFMRDTTLEDDELDLGENEEGVSLTEDVSNRCYPLKVPFACNDKTMVDENDRNLIPENELILLQLPSLFPTMVPVQPPSESGETPKKRGSKVSVPTISANRGIGTPFSDIPDGKIGRMRIHKSGKTVMEIGKTQFLVKEGQRPNFRSEVACLCPKESEIIFLGQATKRVVVSPVIT